MGMKTTAACLEWLILQGKKDKLTTALFEKTLSLKSEKYSSTKNEGVWANTMILDADKKTYCSNVNLNYLFFS